MDDDVRLVLARIVLREKYFDDLELRALPLILHPGEFPGLGVVAAAFAAHYSMTSSPYFTPESSPFRTQNERSASRNVDTIIAQWSSKIAFCFSSLDE